MRGPSATGGVQVPLPVAEKGSTARATRPAFHRTDGCRPGIREGVPVPFGQRASRLLSDLPVIPSRGAVATVGVSRTHPLLALPHPRHGDHSTEIRMSGHAQSASSSRGTDTAHAALRRFTATTEASSWNTTLLVGCCQADALPGGEEIGRPAERGHGIPASESSSVRSRLRGAEFETSGTRIASGRDIAALAGRTA